jgi:DNA invertase Pin-like site-specific DNA recombinase
MTETAARWLRVSSGGQDERSQEPEIDGYIAGHGYATGPTYTLHDVSAFKGEQDDYLAQAITDAKAGKLDVLVGWHVDRLDRRGPWATGDFVRQLAAVGVRVETVSEGVISDRDLNGLVKQWSGREESEHKAERVRIAHSARKARGALVGKVGWGKPAQAAVELLPVSPDQSRSPSTPKTKPPNPP